MVELGYLNETREVANMNEPILTSYAGIAMLGTRLRNYRIDREMTQQDLALRSGVSLRSIQNFENGRDIQLGNCIKLLIALDLADNLSMLIPDVTTRPSAYLQPEPRQRVRKSKAVAETPATFRWGDEQ